MLPVEFDQLIAGSFRSSPPYSAEFQNVKDELLPERSDRGFMNILLQNRRTLNFLGASTGWTPNHANARIFGTGLEAMFFCLNHDVANMQILGKFADRRMDFTVPVTDLRGN